MPIAVAVARYRHNYVGIKLSIHCKNRIVNMTCSLSFWLQMSEPITHIDMDNCMPIHHKGTRYLDSTAHLFTPLKEMISYRYH